jgi:ATP-dependent helicase HrpB
LIPFDPPEILEADLAPLLMRLAAWGAAPADIGWLDPPPEAALALARETLAALGALDSGGRITAHGRLLVRFGLSPRLAHMLIEGAARGQAGLAGRIAALLEERGAGGVSTDAEERLRRLEADRSPRAVQAQRLAERWSGEAARLQPADGRPPLPPGLLLAEAWPERVARRRRAPGPSDAQVEYLMANGRGVSLEASDPLARAEWLVVADAGGAGASLRVRLAAALPADAVEAWAAARAVETVSLTPDPASGRLARIRTLRLGAIEVARHRAPASAAEVEEALLAEVAQQGLGALPWSEASLAERARLGFAAAHGCSGLPALDDAALLNLLPVWLGPRLAGVRKLGDLQLDGALLELLDWSARQALDRFAPPRLHTPAGTSHAIDYAAVGGPEAEVRVQALFGLGVHPTLADGRVPLTLALTSPAGRVVAKTRDLPGFWKAAWRDVQRDMKGRYPRHPWPDDPATATPTTRTKAADARGNQPRR